MRTIFIILAVAGWVWFVVVAIFLTIRLWPQRARKHDEVQSNAKPGV